MFLKYLCIVVLWFGAVVPSLAVSVLPLQLDQIVADAQVVFHGTCTANRAEQDMQSGQVVTYTTFEVQEVMKGSVGLSHTIKQIGGQIGATNYQVDGVPAFTIGQEYMVFLYGVSGAGFSSPVGLGQGRFVVEQGPAGKKLSNGRDFNEMIPNGVPSAAGKPARSATADDAGESRHLGLDDFKQIVRDHVGGAK